MTLDPEWIKANYADLRKAAHALMTGEDPSHTLSATGLLHEVYFKLKIKEVDNPRAYVVKAMRTLLLEHARAKQMKKRSGKRVSLEDTFVPDRGASLDEVIVVQDGVDRLRKVDEDCAEVMELYFYIGMGQEEIASKLQVSLATVKKRLAKGKSWLRTELGGINGPGPTR